jgi:hypothetical protein
MFILFVFSIVLICFSLDKLNKKEALILSILLFVSFLYSVAIKHVVKNKEKFVDASPDSVLLINESNLMCLTQDSGFTYCNPDNKKQLWTIKKVSNNKSDLVTIQNENYFVLTFDNANNLLSFSIPFKLNDKHYFKYLNNGSIVHAASNKCIDIDPRYNNILMTNCKDGKVGQKINSIRANEMKNMHSFYGNAVFLYKKFRQHNIDLTSSDALYISQLKSLKNLSNDKLKKLIKIPEFANLSIDTLKQMSGDQLIQLIN